MMQRLRLLPELLLAKIAPFPVSPAERAPAEALSEPDASRLSQIS